MAERFKESTTRLCVTVPNSMLERIKDSAGPKESLAAVLRNSFAYLDQLSRSYP